MTSRDARIVVRAALETLARPGTLATRVPRHSPAGRANLPLATVTLRSCLAPRASLRRKAAPRNVISGSARRFFKTDFWESGWTHSPSSPRAAHCSRTWRAMTHVHGIDAMAHLVYGLFSARARRRRCEQANFGGVGKAEENWGMRTFLVGNDLPSQIGLAAGGLRGWARAVGGNTQCGSTSSGATPHIH